MNPGYDLLDTILARLETRARKSKIWGTKYFNSLFPIYKKKKNCSISAVTKSPHPVEKGKT